MTRVATRLLERVYHVSGAKVQVIPHGVPEVPYHRDGTRKARLGFAGRQVICTFGLINRGKGLEYMIKAMPRIVAACPDAVYLIVGVTHPQVKRQEGEVYRESLVEMAEALGVGGHVHFVNKYLSLADLWRTCRLATCTSPLIRERTRLPAVPWPMPWQPAARWSALLTCMPKKFWRWARPARALRPK